MNLLLMFICMFFSTPIENNEGTNPFIFHRWQSWKLEDESNSPVHKTLVVANKKFFNRKSLSLDQLPKLKNDDTTKFNKPVLLRDWPKLKENRTGEFLEDYEIPLSEDNETPKENTSTNQIEGKSISAIKDTIGTDFDRETPIESSAQTHPSYEEKEEFSDSESEPEEDNNSNNPAQRVENELETSAQTWRQYFRSKIPSRLSLPAMPNMPSLPSMPGMPPMPNIPKMSLPRPSWPKFLARKNAPQEEQISTEISYQEEPTEKPAKASWWPWSKKN